MKKRFLAFSASLILCFSLSTGLTAMAGNVDKTLVDENFSSGELDSATWYVDDDTGIEFNSDEKPVLKINQPTAGTSLTSLVKVNEESMRVELDIDKIKFGKPSGWFGVMYNQTNTNNGQFLTDRDNPSSNSDGIFFHYHEKVDQLVFATIRGLATKFVDGQGKVIPQKTQWAYYDASMLVDADDKNAITGKTLIIKYSDGGVEVRMKKINETGDGELKIKSAEDNKLMKKVKQGSIVSLGFVESAGCINDIAIKEFKIESLDRATVYNSFTKNNLNNYKKYATPATKNFFFGLNSSLHFSNLYRASNPLILAKKIIANDFNDNFAGGLDIDMTLKINEISADGKFGLGAGLEYRSSGQIGDAKTTFVYFTKIDGKINCGVESYNANAEKVELKVPSEINRIDSDIVNCKVSISNKGKISVSINGAEFFTSKESESYAENYAALGLLGDNNNLDVDILKIKEKNRYYDRPQNADISTSFDKNEFNTNDWYLYSTPYMDTFTNGCYVKDGQVVFNNVAMNSGISTQKQFSNFEFTFDITNLRRETVYDNMGNHIYPPSSFIGLFWGAAASYVNFGNVGIELPLVYIEAPVDVNTWERQKDTSGKLLPCKIFAMGNGLNYSVALPDRYDFWDPSKEGESLQLKVTVEDTDVNVAIKYVLDDSWYNVCSLQMEKSMTGNVSICGMGNNYYVPEISEGASCGNFTLDNLIVKNLDDNASLIKYDFISNKKPPLTDYPYTDKDNDEEYLINVNGKGCKGSILNESLYGLCILSIVIFGLKRRKV